MSVKEAGSNQYKFECYSHKNKKKDLHIAVTSQEAEDKYKNSRSPKEYHDKKRSEISQIGYNLINFKSTSINLSDLIKNRRVGIKSIKGKIFNKKSAKKK